MQIDTLALDGLLLIQPKKIGDRRGYFSEIWRHDLFSREANDVSFVQENQSLSAKAGTIRGIHFQADPNAQGKLVRCLAGAIFDVAVDLRKGSPTYGRWLGIELTADALDQLWIPVGFGHAFCTLLPDTVVSYKVTAVYSRECDMGLRWNDPAIGIEWPAAANPATLSTKDLAQPLLWELPAYFYHQT